MIASVTTRTIILASIHGWVGRDGRQYWGRVEHFRRVCGVAGRDGVAGGSGARRPRRAARHRAPQLPRHGGAL